jgi:hypothetical protein
MDWIKEYETFASSEWKPTELPVAEEGKFREWLAGTRLFQGFKQEVAKDNGLPVTAVQDSRVMQMLLQSKDYDYRGAWKAGIKEEVSPHDNRIHWPSSTGDGRMLKSPKHETTWKEFFMRQHDADPDDLGLSTLEQAKKWQSDSGGRLSKRPLMRGKQ